MRTEGPCTKGVPSALKCPKGMQIVRHHRFTGSMRTRPVNPGIYVHPVPYVRMVWKLRVIICRRTCCRSVGPNSNCGSGTDLNIELPEETGPKAATRFGPYCASASGIAIIESSSGAPMHRNRLGIIGWRKLVQNAQDGSSTRVKRISN